MNEFLPFTATWMDLEGIILSEVSQTEKIDTGGRGKREVQERGDICIHTADSCCCMAETNTTL